RRSTSASRGSAASWTSTWTRWSRACRCTWRCWPWTRSATRRLGRVSNLEVAPAETACASSPAARRADVLTGHEVVLGRYTSVRRLLPHTNRRMVGAWCFVDLFGPDAILAGPGMQVPPHPHCGLQTVTWLADGEVLHRDSLGSLAMIRPGQLNLMTAGAAIAHDEVSPDRHGPAVHRLALG